MGKEEGRIQAFVAWEVTVNPETGKVSKAVSVDYVLPAEVGRKIDEQYREARKNNLPKLEIVKISPL